MFWGFLPPSVANLGALSLLPIAALWLRCITRRGSFVVSKKHDNVKVAYLWNPRAFVLSPDNFFQSVHPVQVKILTQEFYVVRGPETVKAFFKGSWACTSILGYAFGLPAKALSLYDKKDSGGGHVPHIVSTVGARNRLLPFWNRFADNIAQQFHGLHDCVGPDWGYHADLMKVVGDEAADFDRNLQIYLQGIPWFLARRASAARKRVDHYNDSAVGADGDDPFWGSNFFRDRQEMFLEMDAIWAARNSITAASWTIFEICRDPELLASVRAEVDACALKGADGRTRFDIDRLPILQAAYAETLRLRMHFYIIRMPDRVDMNIRDWIIPRRKVIVTTTTNEHLVDQFWIGRFLKSSNIHQKGGHGDTQPHDTTTSSPTISTKELEGSWIPYGGGPRLYPGRHFAKR
ncbi:cytochrome P450 [Hypoxylon rubiginosum]|uniref:Cytochrome P450 n=1 Tax=Hypoxylon rubiginosum TaxID=110542 RepID=A0ACB9YSS5_9PEZI|nr:cytochrome P450 [Hypoxylon rubiginosum]